MLPQNLKPIFTEKLIRLGNNLDGGYVVNDKMINECETCITFGLGDNFSFEKDLKKKKPTTKIYVYDHTINFFYLIKHFFFWLWHSFRFRKFNTRFLYFLDYLIFFKLNDNNHIKLEISKINSLTKIMNELKITPEKTILKIDIDGAEYEIIDEIYKFNFLGIIIEFENADKNIDKILHFIDKNKNLKIIHLHANNFLPIGRNGVPKALEFTFINSNLIKNEIENNRSYPIPEIDFPNNPLKKDIFLNFKKKT